MSLWHYTCDHGHDGIGERGMLLPNLHIQLNVRLSWLTDMAEPERLALGLTNQFTGCDRTRFRYRLERSGHVMPWGMWAALNHPDETLREDLERYGNPDRWWVGMTPLAVVLDQPRKEEHDS